MIKSIALGASLALGAAGAVAAHPGHQVREEKRVCMIKKDGDAEAKEVPCESLPHGPGHGPMAGHGGHGGPGRHHMMMSHHGGPGHLDADKDGRVSLEEFTAPMREHFAEMDSNKSGYLEKDEIPSGPVIIEKRIEKKD